MRNLMQDDHGKVWISTGQIADTCHCEEFDDVAIAVQIGNASQIRQRQSRGR